MRIKAWQESQTRNAREHNRSISGLGGQCCVGGRHKEVTVQHRPALSPVLRSHPLSSSACRQVQWLPGASSPHPPPNPQHPGCFLKLFFSLPLLFSPRISTCASKYPYDGTQLKKNSEVFNPMILISSDLFPGSESPTSPMEATTMSTLGNQSSLTSQRFFPIPISHKIMIIHMS